MRCPECQQEMLPQGNFWFCGRHSQPVILSVSTPPSQKLSFIDNLPTPIALPIAEYLNESSPFIVLHRLTDAAELITRFFAIASLSNIHQQQSDFPEEIKVVLAENLERPTFGAWRNIADKALRHLKKQHQFIPELAKFWQNTWQPLLGKNQGNLAGKIITLRNNLAHGGRLPEPEAEALLSQHRPQFEEALQQLEFLTNYRLIATLKAGEAPLYLRGLPNKIPGFYPGCRLENILIACSRSASIYSERAQP